MIVSLLVLVFQPTDIKIMCLLNHIWPIDIQPNITNVLENVLKILSWHQTAETYLSHDEERFWSAGNADRFKMTQRFGENGKFDFRSLQSAKLVFVIQPPDEHLYVAERISFPAKTVQSRPARDRRAILRWKTCLLSWYFRNRHCLFRRHVGLFEDDLHSWNCHKWSQYKLTFSQPNLSLLKTSWMIWGWLTYLKLSEMQSIS